MGSVHIVPGARCALFSPFVVISPDSATRNQQPQNAPSSGPSVVLSLTFLEMGKAVSWLAYGVASIALVWCCGM